MAQPQNFENHAKFVPAFHIVTLGIFFINLIWSISRVIRSFSMQTVMSVLLAIAFLLAALYARTFALAVQDRVIRLEERLRLQAIAPAEWHAQIYKLTEDQLIGLRFAADDEVVELAKQALEHNLNRKQIKERIKNWRPDEFRV